MNTYKIINITNRLPKRDRKFNSIVDIEYIDNRARKVLKLKAGETVFLTVSTLPLSVHRLRIKNLITVSEISAVELIKSIQVTKVPKKVKPKMVKKPVNKKEPILVEETAESVVSKKKTTTRKKTES